MSNLQENEISKHIKSTGSNISKSNRKSKHKHHYEECLLQYNFKYLNKNILTTNLHSYCTICGKINDRFKDDKTIVKDYKKVVHTPAKDYFTTITGEELYENYHDKMPVFFVDDIFKNKYVDLENE